MIQPSQSILFRQPMPLCAGAYLLPEFARPRDAALIACVDEIAAAAPWRHMLTPGGQQMSVAMTNCGPAGWVTDRRGYRYQAEDPESGRAWPRMPTLFAELARRAAAMAGFDEFEPDACLINRYVPGARMSLHQDKDERDFNAPIVSVSLGVPATFLLGGLRRADKPQRIALSHGDVVVWGGTARLRFHGVLPLKPGLHDLLGAQRINLTFRKAQ
jgi:DNA oxidative demethylase